MLIKQLAQSQPSNVAKLNIYVVLYNIIILSFFFIYNTKEFNTHYSMLLDWQHTTTNARTTLSLTTRSMSQNNYTNKQSEKVIGEHCIIN